MPIFYATQVAAVLWCSKCRTKSVLSGADSAGAGSIGGELQWRWSSLACFSLMFSSKHYNPEISDTIQEVLHKHEITNQ
jgi:hypothetical protein